MSRRVVGVTLDNLGDLPPKCRRCVFWELAPHIREQAEEFGETALEKECGHRLLLKQGRTVALTPKARILVEHTEKILHELTLAQTALESTDDSPAGTVRL